MGQIKQVTDKELLNKIQEAYENWNQASKKQDYKKAIKTWGWIVINSVALCTGIEVIDRVREHLTK